MKFQLKGGLEAPNHLPPSQMPYIMRQRSTHTEKCSQQLLESWASINPMEAPHLPNETSQAWQAGEARKESCRQAWAQ